MKRGKISVERCRLLVGWLSGSNPVVVPLQCSCGHGDQNVVVLSRQSKMAFLKNFFQTYIPNQSIYKRQKIEVVLAT